MTSKKKADDNELAKFTKAQLVASRKYSDRKDVLNVVLKDDELYSFEDVDSLIDKFMKGKVN